MEETKTQTAGTSVAPTSPGVAPAGADTRAPRRTFGDKRGPAQGQRGGGGKGGPRGGRRDDKRAPREKPEFETKMISIRRVTRVVSGGRRFSLSVAVISGDRKGRVGIGTGKALDTQVAIEKASKAAKRNMMYLKLSKKGSLPFEIDAKFKSALVSLRPNNGKGLIAGSSARTILSLAGLHDVTAKFNSGTKNKLNNARVTMKALEKIAYARGEAPVEATKIPEAVVVEEVVTETLVK
jgi:small subunit ribosomal protein S5